MDLLTIFTVEYYYEMEGVIKVFFAEKEEEEIWEILTIKDSFLLLIFNFFRSLIVSRDWEKPAYMQSDPNVGGMYRTRSANIWVIKT